MNDVEFTLVSVPFSWNDNFSEIALKDFSMIQKDLSYCTSQSIGMALAKLKLLEEQGCEVEENENENRKNKEVGNFELECRICGFKFMPIKDKHYISRDNCESGLSTAFKSTEMNLYDTFDCPVCGCQMIIQERKRVYVEALITNEEEINE